MQVFTNQHRCHRGEITLHERPGGIGKKEEQESNITNKQKKQNNKHCNKIRNTKQTQKQKPSNPPLTILLPPFSPL